MKIAGAEVAADTSAVIRFLNSEKEAVDAFWQAKTIYLPFVVKGELLFGAMRSSRVQENLKRLIKVFAACPTISSNDNVEKEYAKIKLQLYQKGRPIPENDIWIAACAKAYEIPLLAHDIHFNEIEDLDTIGFPSTTAD